MMTASVVQNSMLLVYVNTTTIGEREGSGRVGGVGEREVGEGVAFFFFFFFLISLKKKKIV